MGKDHPIRAPLLNEWYSRYLDDHDTAGFIRLVSERYTIATLERLVTGGERQTRRAAVLALGSLADFSSNTVLGHALLDNDRGVRTLADGAIRAAWCRDGKQSHRRRLEGIVRLNAAREYEQAGEHASLLVNEAPGVAEAWNQRAIAYYGSGRFAESIHDCKQALELNPFHFAAAAGMGQCYMRLGKQALALEWFSRALAINPDLEAVRANVIYLRRSLKQQ